jgi:hypothetical protein
MPNRVLIAGHSQVKYFDQYLKLSNVDVVSFSGYPSKWTPVVLEHFNKFVSPSIQYHSGKWVIEEYPGMFDPYSGITNNLSESMNDVLKRENDWKELPVNLLALGSMPIYPLQRVFDPQNRPCTPKIVGTFYMKGYKVKEKTAIVPHCTSSFKTQWAPCLGFIAFKTLRTMKFYVAGQVWVIII